MNKTVKLSAEQLEVFNSVLPDHQKIKNCESLEISYKDYPKYKAGDIVKSNNTGSVYKLIEELDSSDRGHQQFRVELLVNTFLCAQNLIVNVVNVRHATEEEIKWAKIGRQVNQIMIGDVCEFVKNDGVTKEFYKISREFDIVQAESLVKDNYLTELYPVNSGLKFA